MLIILHNVIWKKRTSLRILSNKCKHLTKTINSGTTNTTWYNRNSSWGTKWKMNWLKLNRKSAICKLKSFSQRIELLISRMKLRLNCNRLIRNWFWNKMDIISLISKLLTSWLNLQIPKRRCWILFWRSLFRLIAFSSVSPSHISAESLQWIQTAAW